MMGSELAAWLASPELTELLGEHQATLASNPDGMLAAARDGQKPLLEYLKACGVSKMGHRQKLAKLLRERLDVEAQPHVVQSATAAAPAAPAAAAAAASSDDDFWSGIIDLSAASTAADIDLAAPVELDTSQYRDTIHTPRERASIARSLAASESPVTSLPAAAQTTHSAAPASLAADGDGSCGGSSYDGAQSALDQLATYRDRGNVAFARGDFTAAERWYEKAAAIEVPGCATADGTMHAEHATVLNNLAACALSQTPPDPRSAMLRLRPVLAAYPKHAKARLRAGRCCVMLGQLQAAHGHFEVALAVEKPSTPSEGLKLRWAPPKDPADKLLLSHDGKTPLSQAAQAAADGMASASKLLSHCERCRSLGASGRADEALYLARAVCRSVTHATTGQLLVVRTLEGCGRLWEAQQEAEAACDEFPNDEELGVACARVLARRGKLADAESQLGTLARSHPGEATRAMRALKGLRAASRLKTEGNQAYAAGDMERAASQYGAAMEADVEGCLRPTLLANRAQARLQGSRHSDALADCSAAIALDAGNAKLLLRRAACHVALKQPAKAKIDYEAVIRLDPSCELAREFLDKAGGGAGSVGAGDGEAAEEDDINPYDVLGLPASCTPADIKSAYRKLALQCHPDKHADGTEEAQADAERQFRLLNLANSLLSDAYKRRQYDAGGRTRDIMR